MGMFYFNIKVTEIIKNHRLQVLFIANISVIQRKSLRGKNEYEGSFFMHQIIFPPSIASGSTVFTSKLSHAVLEYLDVYF